MWLGLLGDGNRDVICQMTHQSAGFANQHFVIPFYTASDDTL